MRIRSRRGLFRVGIWILPVLVMCSAALAQQSNASTPPATNAEAVNAPSQPDYSAIFKTPRSRSPLSAYSPASAPEPQLTNSPDLNRLIRDGKLYMSLNDAIRLALQN